MTTWHKTTTGWLFALDRWGAKVCDISPDGLMVTLFDTAGKIIGSWDRRSGKQAKPREPRKLRDRDSLYWDQSPEPPTERYTPPTPPVDESSRPVHMLVTGNGFSVALCEAESRVVRYGWQGTMDELAVTCPKCRAKLDEKAAEPARMAYSGPSEPLKVSPGSVGVTVDVDEPSRAIITTPGQTAGMEIVIPLSVGAQIKVEPQ